MGRSARTLVIVALVLVAGAAMANNGRGPIMAQSTTPVLPPEVTGSNATGTAPPGTVPTPTSTLSTPTTSTPTTTTSTGALEPATIERIVAFARTVEPGAATVSAFTVPPGRRLVITDVVVTNPGTSAACGAAITPGGAAGTSTASTPTTTPTTTTTTDGTTVITNGNGTTVGTNGSVPTAPEALAALESGTGALCIPAQTSLPLALTTGLEFAGGQRVLLANREGATTDAAATAAPLHFHLRGFLVVADV